MNTSRSNMNRFKSWRNYSAISRRHWYRQTDYCIWTTCHLIQKRTQEAERQGHRANYWLNITNKGYDYGERRRWQGGKKGGGKMVKRKARKRDKGEQVLIGERPGVECQRYLLSQRGLRCEARLSKGPQRCEVIMGKRGGRQTFRWKDTGRKGDRESECATKAGCRNNGSMGRNNRLRWIKWKCVWYSVYVCPSPTLYISYSDPGVSLNSCGCRKRLNVSQMRYYAVCGSTFWVSVDLQNIRSSRGIAGFREF